MREWLIRKLGGVPLPKAGEGQHIVGPVVRKNPVRIKKHPATKLGEIIYPG